MAECEGPEFQSRTNHGAEFRVWKIFWSRKSRRGVLVKTDAILANTLVPALTSRALLAKRGAGATVLGELVLALLACGE
jgi:hypothetical protein